MSAVTGVVVTLDHPAPAPLVAWTALAVFVAAWFAFGRRTFDGAPGWQAFAVVIVAVGFAGALADPAFATWQTVAFPLLWSMHRARSAAPIVANVGPRRRHRHRVRDLHRAARSRRSSSRACRSASAS